MIYDEIEARRAAQIAKGYDAAHDDCHTQGEIARAAAAYAIHASGRPELYASIGRQPGRGANAGYVNGAHLFWPFEPEAFKPYKTTPRDNLLNAAALIVAEIERLDRIAAPTCRQREGTP